MRMITAAIVLASALAGNLAQAQPARTDLNEACQQEARRRTLEGEALNDFMRRCSAGQVSLPQTVTPPETCEERAKLLSGEEKTRFMRDCTVRR